MLAPASQAKTAFLVQNGDPADTTLDALCESLNQPAVFSFESSLCSIARLQLAEDARHMILYCAFGEEECARDFSVAGTLRNKAKYLDFTFGQRLGYGVSNCDCLSAQASKFGHDFCGH